MEILYSHYQYLENKIHGSFFCEIYPHMCFIYLVEGQHRSLSLIFFFWGQTKTVSCMSVPFLEVHKAPQLPRLNVAKLFKVCRNKIFLLQLVIFYLIQALYLSLLLIIYECIYSKLVLYVFFNL